MRNPSSATGPRRKPVRTWKLYTVSISGVGREIIHALSKDAALREARNSPAFASMTIARLRQIAAVYRIKEPLPNDGYDYVREQYGLDVRLGARCWVRDHRSSHYGAAGIVIYPGRSTNSIKVALDDADTPTIFHPLDISMGHPPKVSQAA